MLGRTRSAARWVRLGLAFALPAALVSPFGGCGLDTQGSAAQCKQDVDCVKVDQPCQIWRCENLGCASASQPDGRAPTQIPGDCFQAICDEGITRQVFDDNDVDDLNPCTTRKCVKVGDGGEVISTNVDNGEKCKLGQADGLCKDGVCEVICETGGDCDDRNPCTDGQCNEGKCDFTGKHAFVLPDKNPQDCLQDICNGSVEATVPSLSETPEDGNECTDNVCVDGQPTFPARTGQPCGDSDGECNDRAVCVGCSDADDCGEDTVCRTPNCKEPEEECELINEPVGTIVTLDPAGDCQAIVCDVNGNEVSGANDGDLPGDGDRTDCKLPNCSGGAPVEVNRALNDSCSANGGTYCNSAGSCVQCNDTAQCGMPDVCTTRACTSNMCIVTNVPAGQNPGACPGATCVGATFTPGKTCNGSGQCSGGAMSTCSGNFSCNSAGNACNTSCAGSGDCQAGYACAPNGTCREAPGSSCSGGGECASGNCVDGVCCTTSSCSTCASCNLNGNGTCQNHSTGQQDPSSCSGAGMACDSAQQCKKVNGQTCGTGSECVSTFCRDGRCCVSQCDTDCLDCDVAGHFGECYFTPDGVDDGSCNGPKDCNGAGMCE